MRLSVVVPVFNKGDLACKCLKLNALHAKEPLEWIIIDNHSEQETVIQLVQLEKELVEMGHSVILRREETNTGVAIAWNTGLSLANQNAVCILNNDAVMQPGWVGYAFESFNKGLDFFTPLVIETPMVGKGYSLSDFLGEKFTLPEYRNQNWIAIQSRNRGKFRPGYFGGVLIFGLKESFDKLGGFDGKFWLSLEDMDFLLRAEVAGLKVGTTGDFCAFHFSGATRNSMQVHLGKNQDAFEDKWGWNFEKNEHSFFNKLIRSWQKRVWKMSGTLSEWACNYPKTPPIKP